MQKRNLLTRILACSLVGLMCLSDVVLASVPVSCIPFPPVPPLSNLFATEALQARELLERPQWSPNLTSWLFRCLSFPFGSERGSLSLGSGKTKNGRARFILFPSKSHGTFRKLPRSPLGISSRIPLPAPDKPFFSFIEVQTIAAAAALAASGTIGLAGKMLQRMDPVLLNRKDVSIGEIRAEMERVLKARSGDWRVPRNVVMDILDHAYRGEYNPEKEMPSKVVIRSVKDVADAISKKAVISVTEKLSAPVPGGTEHFFGSSEGLGRDVLSKGEAIGSGELLKVPQTRATKLPEEKVKQILREMGLLSRYYKLIDVLEGTNASVGVIETGVAYKEGDALPPGVQLADFSGASSVGIDIRPDDSDLNFMNADDGYAHVMLTFMPEGREAEFESEPLDPDRPEESFPRILHAWGNKAPSEVNVVILNRERERANVQWLSDHGYQVTLIPDGTLIPSIFVAMGGQLGRGPVIIWTTSGAPEAMMALGIQKENQPYGAVGSAYLYPGKLIKDHWMGHVGLTEQELNWYLEVRNLDEPSEAVKEFNEVVKGKFTWSEIRRYEQLRPQDWISIVTRKKIFGPQDANGNVDGAFTFVTDNKVFKEKGVQVVHGNGTTLWTLRVQNHNGISAAWIQETEGNLQELANGEAFAADLQREFEQRWRELEEQENSPKTPAAIRAAA